MEASSTTDLRRLRAHDTIGPCEIDGDDAKYLRRRDRPDWRAGVGEVRIVDLFCGAGGLTLGALEAARSLGLAARCRLAIDFDAAALACHRVNLSDPADQDTAIAGDVAEHFAADLDARTTATERRLIRKAGEVDLLLGGPPCQGHSDLNNFSRRDDPKNGLYRCMARAARVLRPRHVVIENVAGAAHDRGGVVRETIDALQRLGYEIESGLVDALRLGVPQRRRRLLVIASRVGCAHREQHATSKAAATVGRTHPTPSIESIHAAYSLPSRHLRWAIGDLVDEPPASPFETPSTPSRDNRARIAHLFERDLYDLPDEQRPPCHRDKPHTYRSVYGRLRWDRPTGTITSGFYSTCMGRYVHPSRRRTLTAHEAARVQFFPDFFDFAPCGKRSNLARVIGNAVPMKVAWAVVRELLRRDC